MSLELSVPDKNPTTGLSGTKTRPITEGERMNVFPNERVDNGGFFGVLDRIGESIGTGVGDAVQLFVDKKISDINGGPETTVDSTGDPFDNPKNTDAKTSQSLFEQYKQPILFGGAVLLAAVAIKLVK